MYYRGVERVQTRVRFEQSLLYFKYSRDPKSKSFFAVNPFRKTVQHLDHYNTDRFRFSLLQVKDKLFLVGHGL